MPPGVSHDAANCRATRLWQVRSRLRVFRCPLIAGRLSQEREPVLVSGDSRKLVPNLICCALQPQPC